MSCPGQRLPFNSVNRNINGYPVYRRRELQPGETEPRTVKEGRQNCQCIVPYNAYLIKKYRCHLNVEACTSIRSVKYLYKYTYKGPDRSAVSRNFDELKDHLDTRWVGAPEAMWRILQFNLHGKSHQVVRLPVILPLRQNVILQEGMEASAMEKATV